MKLEQLLHIIEIEKQKSISKAAKALYIGQPTLSSSLTSLEEEIGVKLFERTYSGVVPTEAGKEAVHLARQALDATTQIQNLGKKQERLTGTVTVLIGHVYSYLYNDVLLRFKQLYPQAELRLLVRSHDEVIDDVMAGNADIGLALVGEALEATLQSKLKERDYQLESFGQYRIKIFVASGSRYAQQEAVSMMDLRQEQLIASFTEWKYTMQKWIQPERDILVVSDNESLKRMICDGSGIAILPEMFEKQEFHCAQGTIHALQIEEKKEPEIMGCLLSRQRKTLLEEKTIQLLKELL